MRVTPCSPRAPCSMDETTARGSWGCGAAPCFPSGMGRWQPDTLPAARKTVGHPEYKYAQPSMWLVAKPCRSQLNLWSQCCTTDRGGLGSEIHLQGVPVAQDGSLKLLPAKPASCLCPHRCRGRRGWGALGRAGHRPGPWQ